MKSFLVDFVEKYGSYSINYMKFRDQVELHQLMPDKAVMRELRELRRAHVQYQQWRADREASKKELADQQLDDARKEQMSQDEKDDFEVQRQESVKNIESEMDTQKEQDVKNQERIKELLHLSRRSIDEERDTATYFTDKVYKADFIPDKESINCVPSIVSAMVSQIAVENAQAAGGRESEMEASTEPETLDDIFENAQREIAYDTNLKEREPEEEEFGYAPLKGVLPAEINVYETYDTSTQPI